MSSHRQIFRSSAIIGVASIVSILIGVLNVKVIAVLLGASSVGLMGIYQNVIGVASTLFGLGVSRSGIRELALGSTSGEGIPLVRRALVAGNLALGLAGMFTIYFFKDAISRFVFGDVAHAHAVALLGVGVFITLVGGAQSAVLQGLRKIKQIAQVNIAGALLSSGLGVAVIYSFREDGVIWFVLMVPLMTMALATLFASKVVDETQGVPSGVCQKFEGMLKMGTPLMLATLVNLTTQLIVRSIILRDLGSEASGHFQAAWTISMTYIGFVLGAMATDFYPRLSGVIRDRRAASSLVHDQAEMALLLAGPVLLTMNISAPLVMELLYSKDFVQAADILRWQILGDILKVGSWPMGFILAATGRSGLTLLSEMCWSVVYVAVAYFVVPQVGLFFVGVGFFLAYLILYFVVAISARSLIGYRVSARLAAYTVGLLVLNGGVAYSLANLPHAMGVAVSLGAFVLMVAFVTFRLGVLLNMRELIKKRYKG